MVTEDRIVRPGEVEQLYGKRVEPIAFAVNQAIKYGHRAFRAVLRQRMLAGLTVNERKYIRKRVSEIQIDDAFAVPVTAYLIMCSRYCSSRSGAGCHCDGGKRRAELDKLITKYYGTREEIIRG